MLILTRHTGEVVVITTPDGTEIRVALVSVDKGRGRLGFQAPSGVIVDRLEVHKTKLRDAAQKRLAPAASGGQP